MSRSDAAWSANCQRQFGKANWLSLLLLGGIGFGGAGVFSQLYRIEVVPQGQAFGSPAAAGQAESQSLSPEVILLDGCEAAPPELRAEVPLLPKRRLASLSKAPAELPPCEEDIRQPAVAQSGSAAALDGAVTADSPSDAIGSIGNDTALDPAASGAGPIASGPVGPVSADNGFDHSLPLLVLGPLGSGLAVLPSGISSLPAEENGNSTTNSSGGTTSGGGGTTGGGGGTTGGGGGTTGGGGATASVPEPATLLLLGTGLAGLALARRRRSA